MPISAAAWRVVLVLTNFFSISNACSTVYPRAMFPIISFVFRLSREKCENNEIIFHARFPPVNTSSFAVCVSSSSTFLHRLSMATAFFSSRCLL